MPAANFVIVLSCTLAEYIFPAASKASPAAGPSFPARLADMAKFIGAIGVSTVTSTAVRVALAVQVLSCT